MLNRNSSAEALVIAVTMGDINGVGPEIFAKAAARPEVRAACRFVVLGSVGAYERVRRSVPGAPAAITAKTARSMRGAGDGVVFLEGLPEGPEYRPGVLDPDAGRCAMAWLARGVELALSGKVDALVTCPINKAGIHRAGFPFQGHTDFIAERCGSPGYRMCLFAGPMRVVHVSAHLSLREALDQVTQARISESIRIGHRALLGLGMARPRIAVAGLNPHAGEDGAFGREEIEVISPAIEECRGEGIACSGPYSPDAVLGRMRSGEFDMVIAMYHDQGHIPMKLIAMDEGVNVTLGIPIIRTSPDHGTAYDIAGKNVAREDSLCAAIELAAQWASMKKRTGR